MVWQMNNIHAKLFENSDRFANQLITSAKNTHRETFHSKLDQIIRENYTLGKSTKLNQINKNLEQIKKVEKNHLEDLKK